MKRVLGTSVAVTVLVVSIVGVVMGTALAPAARGKQSCNVPRGGKTILLSREARVYKHRGRTSLCITMSGRRIRLGDEDPDRSFPSVIRVRSLRLSKRYLAYVYESSREETERFIYSYSLRAPKRRSFVAEQREAERTQGAPSGVTDLEVSDRGALAWIVQNAYASPPRPEVHVADKAGARVLDSSPGIERGSLALARGRVYWSNGNTPRSERLSE